MLRLRTTLEYSEINWPTPCPIGSEEKWKEHSNRGGMSTNSLTVRRPRSSRDCASSSKQMAVFDQLIAGGFLRMTTRGRFVRA